ncbi:bifunctional 4-hydroxy-2-oxoglutarate aldolase/2-dehydro-3-deoxy-phosphogluconate aldolase [Sphingobacterium hungaricum]|uniref:Bifunctional 4-hydroxy-2-oxoglutarate aldolase/2-dehydro-3-deoxy-phosphogluconate aldolase n=1 Tax=Sphingobacterium hungaricum TaxID=2082723 RepID=A0A928V3M9_9SPHI|nr:bifunctional 4-hydroxy-2-oxoglutarate aldolase/2-dehydro-3-deoxy-phosphogluconate aldolase [Sphingobacterium hungaricum]MBE8715519.1 bifunctional 4-hydroxy-2-oxoglutarate aldolase/2-dehydro-3-deoxy-phosphogluconate aldolase [Sphingobacterium hungaricum]
MKEVLDKIEQYPIIPVFYDDDVQKCKDVLKACYNGGIRVFEFVNRGSEAKENFKALIHYKNEFFPDLKLGIGTIKTAQQAGEFIELGAEFIVSPILNEEIASITVEKNILWIPGCMTPTEIAKAEQLHVPLVKLFPGDTLGPKFLKAIKPLFPNVKFMPTGGVDVEANNIKNWFEAGVFSVGLGSKLFQKPEYAEDYDWLEANVKLLFSWLPK